MTDRYYTNVTRSGNRLLVREIRNGKRRKFTTEYHPTLFRPTVNPSEYRTTDGIGLEPFQPGTMYECHDYLKTRKDVANDKTFGNTAYEYAFIQEEYPGRLEYDTAALSICNLDIEVASTEGFSEPEDATEEITAITIKNSQDGIFHVFACKKFENKSPDVIYYRCADEEDLIEQFLALWETMEPDIVLGWNIRMYDIPYLVNRISRVLSQNDAKRLSPWKLIRESEAIVYNRKHVVYDILGVSVLDYLLIYRKNVLEPRESYRLDYIAEVELGERKVDYGEYSGLQELYEKDFQKFVEYNIHDVRLVDRIDAKRKLIDLQLIVAYHAKVNYVDVLSPIKIWETNIVNHLLDKKVVVPLKSKAQKNDQFAGAFVMKPVPGMYEWVCSFDVTSLYPTIMRTLNMGIETKLGPHELTPEMAKYQEYISGALMQEDAEGQRTVNPNAIISGVTETLIRRCREQNVTIGANGQFYRRDPKSFYAEMIEDLFSSRLDYKKKASAAEQEASACKDQKRKAELNLLVSNFDLKQKAVKILLNSLYGALGNQHFKFFSIDNAEAVTTTGQFIIQFIGRGLNDYLNRKMHTTDTRFVIYSDTDSVYLTLTLAVERYCPTGTLEEKVNFLDRMCKEALQKEIDRLFTVITERYLNGVGDYLRMAREVIGDKAIWTAKKRYLINVRDKEGIRKDGLAATLKYMGVEIAKSSVPKFCRDAMKKAVVIVMEQDQEAMYRFVAETKRAFIQLPVEDVSFPRSVNGLEKYAYLRDPQKNTTFAERVTIYTDGTPFHTKGALIFNHLIEKHRLGSKYPRIREGEKIKFFYLREPNPVNSYAMAFLNILPPEFNLHSYIDWEMQWIKAFVEPLQLILDAIKWHSEQTASLAAFFE